MAPLTDQVWGAAALASVDSLSAAVDALLKEYLDNLELASCTHALQYVPFSSCPLYPSSP